MDWQHSLNDQGHFDDALKMYQQTLQIRVTVFGRDHPQVAVTLANIANVYQAQGLYDKALETYEKSLKIDIKVHGLDHLLVADTYNK